MRSIVLISAAAAPVVLIGGWSLAESLQPAGFDPVHDAISDLAALGAPHREVMTVAFFGTGIAYLVTAFGLTGVAGSARALIAFGGVATILVGVFPVPESGGSTAHAAAAGAAFLALAAWPLLAVDRAADAAWVLRPAMTVTAGVVLLSLVAGFGVALVTDASVGLVERVAAAAQSIWPFVVAISVAGVRVSRHAGPR